MTDSELLVIINKRIPDQVEYIQKLKEDLYWERDFFTIPSELREMSYVKALKEKIKRKEFVLESAEGVLENLFKRKLELTNGGRDNSLWET